MAKRKSARASKKAYSLPLSEKISAVMKNMIAFLILFFISFILWNLTSAGFWNDLFLLLALVAGALALAFLIIWLVLRLMRK